MSVAKRFADIAPYLLILCGAVGLYYVADHIVYTPIPDQIGPDRWPKIIIAILFSVCVFEIVRRLIAGAPAPEAAPEATDLEAELLLPHTTRPALVVGTIAVTVAYLLVLDVAGFFSSTIAYSACLMWLGGLRKPLLTAVISVALSFLFTFIFMKLIFVALPLGEGFFEKVSLTVMRLVGVH